jgi:hypothetical protein
VGRALPIGLPQPAPSSSSRTSAQPLNEFFLIDQPSLEIRFNA